MKKLQINSLAKVFSFLSCVILLMTISCKKQDSTEGSNTSLIKKNSKTTNIKTSSVDEITTMSNAIKLTYNSDLSLFNWSSPNIDISSLPILRLWQKRRNCQRLGICQLFPKPIPPKDFEDLEAEAILNPGRILPVYLQLDGITNNFKQLVFYVAEDISSMPSDATDFVIDEDMMLEINYLGFKNLTIPAATYHLDPSIGSFGGYRVSLIGSN